MPSPEPLPIVLVGLRGVGKTTVGRLLASRIAREFVDLDDEIVRTAAASDPADAGSCTGKLMLRHGVTKFRALETAALQSSLAENRPIVLAAGGGVVEALANRRILRERTFCVWLRARPEVLAARVAGDSKLRPALVAGGPIEEARELGARRDPWFREVSKWELDCGDLTAEQTARSLEDRLAGERGEL